MKHLLKTAILGGVLAIGSLTVSTPVGAQALNIDEIL